MSVPNYRLKLRKQKNCRQVIEVSWYEGGKRHAKSTGTADWAEAAEFLRQLKAQRESPHEGPASSFSIRRMLDDYYEEHILKTATDSERVRYCIKALLTFFDGKTLADVTPLRTREYIEFRSVAVETVRRELATLRAAMHHAHRERRVSETVHIQLPQREERLEKWLRDEEFERILAACSTDALRIYCLIRRYTGQRSVAVLDLDWKDVDLEHRRIDWGFGNKNKRRARTQRIVSNRLLLALREYRETQQIPQRPISVEDPSSFLGFRHLPQPVVGYSKEGVKTMFRRAATKVGFYEVTPSWLRHTCITRLIQDGASIEQVSEFVGVSTAVIESTYWHHSPDNMLNLPME